MNPIEPRVAPLVTVCTSVSVGRCAVKEAVCVCGFRLCF